MREAEFQKLVIDIAHMLGYRVAHFRTAMTSRGAYVTPVAAEGRGYPDLTMVRDKRLVFAELKSAKGRLSQEQIKWQEALRGAGVETYIWRPADLDHIAKVLRAA